MQSEQSPISIIALAYILARVEITVNKVYDNNIQNQRLILPVIKLTGTKKNILYFAEVMIYYNTLASEGH